jgi:Tfp pilus assembly protein PilF
MTRGRGLLAFVQALAFLLAVQGAARAEDGEAGRRYFKRGQELLKNNDYRAAAKAFEAGYAAAPRVGFLLNIGNCYRKLGELSKAREHYWRFLDAAPKDHPSRLAVMEYLRQMEQIEADGVSVDTTPTKPAAAPLELAPAFDRPAAPRPASRPSAPAPAVGLTVVDVHTAEEKPPVWKRWWFWTVLGGAVAAGAATYVLTRPASAAGCGASLGCVHE